MRTAGKWKTRTTWKGIKGGSNYAFGTHQPKQANNRKSNNNQETQVTSNKLVFYSQECHQDKLTVVDKPTVEAAMAEAAIPMMEEAGGALLQARLRDVDRKTKKDAAVKEVVRTARTVQPMAQTATRSCPPFSVELK